MNSNINQVPQTQENKKNNIAKLIRRLKEDDLYKEWQEELEEYFELKNFLGNLNR
jgi:hypothetical protein